MRARLQLALVIGLLLAAVLIIGAWSAGEAARYLNPVEMALSSDGRSLYVVCEKSDELRVVDIASGKVVKQIAVGHVPTGISLSPDGKQIYVANSWSDNVSVIDASTLSVSRTLPAGFEPVSVIADREGRTLYTANRLSNDISVIDLQSGKEIKRLVAGRGASYLALSSDGKQIYCTHIYPNIGKFRTPPESEITVIDTVTQDVVERKPLHNVAGVFHLANSNDGKLSGRATQAEEPGPARPRGTRMGLRRYANNLRRRCGRSRPGTHRRTRAVLRAAIRCRHLARQVEDLRHQRRGRHRDRHRHATLTRLRQVAACSVRQRSLCFRQLRHSQNPGRSRSSRRASLPRRQATLRRQSHSTTPST